MISFEGLSLTQISRMYYRQSKRPITFDFKAASKKVFYATVFRNADTHNIHYYPGRMFPYIPLFLLSIDDLNHTNKPILDPFAGCGTVLLESVKNPLHCRSAIGVEKNPVGRLISKVKTTPLNEASIDKYTHEICSIFNSCSDRKSEIVEFKNRKIWFSDKAFEKLSILKYSINSMPIEEKYKDFFWLCYSSTIRKASKADPHIPPPVVLKPEKYTARKSVYEKLSTILTQSEDPPLLERFKEIVNKNKRKIAALNEIPGLVANKISATVIWDDAKKIHKGRTSEAGHLFKEDASPLESNSIGLVFTSPPYLTAQKYIRTSKLELFCLGYSETEVASLTKTSIGTEQVSARTKIIPFNIKPIDHEISKIEQFSRERALQVFQYFKDMIETLNEIKRVLRKNSYAVIVIGDNKVAHKNVETHKLISEAAEQIGLREIVTLRDEIRSRSMPTKRNDTGGIIKNEYVILLRND